MLTPCLHMPQQAEEPLDKLTEPWGSGLGSPLPSSVPTSCRHALTPIPTLLAGTLRTAQNLSATQHSDGQVLEQVALRGSYLN